MAYSAMVGYGIIPVQPCGGRGKGDSAEDEDSANYVEDRVPMPPVEGKV